MKIKGSRLNLDDYPIGTNFVCLGHWDENKVYETGKLYELRTSDNGFRALFGKNDETAYGGYNGYSGIWTLAKINTKLEDWL